MAKKQETVAHSPLRTGSDPRKESNGNGIGWLKIEANQHLDIVCLVDADEIIACEQCAIWLDEGNSPVWVYTGEDDPSHDLGVDRKYRAFLPVLLDGEAKIWSMGKSAHIQLLDIIDAGNNIKGLELRLKRTGSGLGTRYSLVPRGKRINISGIPEVDVVAALGPITPEGVRELIAKKLGKDTYEEVLSAYRGKKVTKQNVAREQKAAGVKKRNPVEDDEDEDLDDLELDDE